MIDRGANPFVITSVCNPFGIRLYNDRTQFDIYSLSYLSNLPRQKSVFFTTRSLPNEFKEQNAFSDPWFYKTGVFEGKFVRVIGQGAAGRVISGEWFGKKAAFKFVEIGTQEFQEHIKDGLKTLNEKLTEMLSIQETVGSKIVSFYGHYR